MPAYFSKLALRLDRLLPWLEAIEADFGVALRVELGHPSLFRLVKRLCPFILSLPVERANPSAEDLVSFLFALALDGKSALDTFHTHSLALGVHHGLGKPFKETVRTAPELPLGVPYNLAGFHMNHHSRSSCQGRGDYVLSAPFAKIVILKLAELHISSPLLS